MITAGETQEDSNHTFTYFGCTINILNRKDYSQAVEQDLSQGRDELRGGHQDIHTVWPAVERQRRRGNVMTMKDALKNKVHTTLIILKQNRWDNYGFMICLFMLTFIFAHEWNIHFVGSEIWTFLQSLNSWHHNLVSVWHSFPVLSNTNTNIWLEWWMTSTHLFLGCRRLWRYMKLTRRRFMSFDLQKKVVAKLCENCWLQTVFNFGTKILWINFSIFLDLQWGNPSVMI